LPNELRWPQFRIGNYYIESEKILRTRIILNSQSIMQSNILQELAIKSIWGEMTQTDIKILIMGIMEIDRMSMEVEEPKQELDFGN